MPEPLPRSAWCRRLSARRAPSCALCQAALPSPPQRTLQPPRRPSTGALGGPFQRSLTPNPLPAQPSRSCCTVCFSAGRPPGGRANTCLTVHFSLLSHHPQVSPSLAVCVTDKGWGWGRRVYRFHSFIQHVLSNAAVLSSEDTAVTNVPAPGADDRHK